MENALSVNPMLCGWSSVFTHRTVEPAVTVMFAGENVFFMMVMVLSDTEAVREGVTTGAGVGRVVVITGGGVVVTVVGTTVGCAGGEPEHPQVSMSRRAIMGSAEIDRIDAGRIFLYNKVVVPPEARTSRGALEGRLVLLPEDTGNR